MLNPRLSLLSLFLFLSSAAHAQELQMEDAPVAQVGTSVSVHAETLSSASVLEAALKVAPTQRKAVGRELASDPNHLKAIDEWIEQTPLDHPDHLKLKDILMAMPISVSGPRLAALAKKSSDPSVQSSWARWLVKYPEVYSSVLVAWLKHARTNPKHFMQLLSDYAALNSSDALNIWVQLRARHTVAELGDVASFGYSHSECASALIRAISTDAFEGEISRLRLFAALTSCNNVGEISESALVLSPQIQALLDHKLPSRRIVGLDVMGALKLSDATLTQKAVQIFTQAKNTTERAHALRALGSLDPSGQSSRLIEALSRGDDTLRFEAATLLASHEDHGVELSVMQTAFEHEQWTDTQFALYQAIVRVMPDDAAKLAFQRSILFDAKRAQPLRELVIEHISKIGKTSLTLDDMAKLTTDGASVNLIASCADYIYAMQPEARPTLRKWLIAQQPFERRLLSSFITFLRIESTANDASASEMVRTICQKAVEQDNILQPCLFYLSDHALTEADQALLKTLQHRRDQVQAMINYDF